MGLKRSEALSLAAVAVIAVALVIVAAYAHLHWPFVSPLSVISTSPVVYLPLVLGEHRAPDGRLGIAEHTPGEAALLGLAGADYISGQWRLPITWPASGGSRWRGDTVVFLRPTERPHWSTWLLGSWSATNGWYDETGFRQWVREHPGTIYLVGNELTLGGSVGDGHWVSVDDYVRWYHEAWEFIKAEDPTAVVAPYGPVQGAGGLLIAVWEAYEERYDNLMPVDFYSVHFYCEVDDSPRWCWVKISNWIDWLERHRGIYWSGPRDYRLTEWGLRAWDTPVPENVALALMAGVVPELKANDIGITQFAWWPSCNSKWPEACTWLVEGGRVTELGRLYYKLALGE